MAAASKKKMPIRFKFRSSFYTNVLNLLRTGDIVHTDTKILLQAQAQTASYFVALSLIIDHGVRFTTDLRNLSHDKKNETVRSTRTRSLRFHSESLLWFLMQILLLYVRLWYFHLHVRSCCFSQGLDLKSKKRQIVFSCKKSKTWKSRRDLSNELTH